MNLEKIRKQTGLNQSEFWGRVGVTQSGGSRYEAGRRMPKPVSMLVTLAYSGNRRDVAKVQRLLLGARK